MKLRKLLFPAIFLLFLLITGWSVVTAWRAEDSRIRAELNLVKLRDSLGRHFTELRQSTEHLAGSTRARLALLEASNDYLSGLIQEGARDSQSRLRLAMAYRNAADLEAGLAASNTRHLAAAINHYKQAVALHEQLNGRDPEARATRIDMLSRLALAAQRASLFRDSTAALSKAEKLFQPGKDTDPHLRQTAAKLYLTQGSLAPASRAAETHYRKAIELLNELESTGRNDAQVQYELARGYRLLSLALGQSASKQQALDAASRSVTLGEAIAAQHPARADYRSGLAASYAAQASLLPGGSARPQLDKALTITAELAATDPDNVQSASEFAYIASRIATAGQDNAPAVLERALAHTTPLIKRFPKSYAPRSDHVTLLIAKARFHRQKGQWREALDACRTALPVAASLIGEQPNHRGIRDQFSAVQSEMQAAMQAITGIAN